MDHSGGTQNCCPQTLTRLLSAPQMNTKSGKLEMRNIAIVVTVFSGLLPAQPLPAEPPQQNVTAFSSQAADTTDAPPNSSSYVLGPGDQLSFRVVDMEEINDKPIAVDLSG